MTLNIKKALYVFLTCALPLALAAQTKKPVKPRTVKKTPPSVAATPQPTPASAELSAPKTNKRPGEPTGIQNIEGRISSAVVPVYFYTFTRPGFMYSPISIEHDDAGKGKISFLKTGYDAAITDPIELSPVTLVKIREALTALNFVESIESYQHERDYSHMGDVSITVKRDGRERTARFNWTDNKHAKILMDEYRRIGNEYTWRFEMLQGRDHHPLETPGLMDMIDTYIRRDEISDPARLLPFLTELSNDERLPLMARNHAAKIIKKISQK